MSLSFATLPSAAATRPNRAVRLLRQDWMKLQQALRAHNRQTGKWPKLCIDPKTKQLGLRLGHREDEVLWILGHL